MKPKIKSGGNEVSVQLKQTDAQQVSKGPLPMNRSGYFAGTDATPGHFTEAEAVQLAHQEWAFDDISHVGPPEPIKRRKLW